MNIIKNIINWGRNSPAREIIVSDKDCRKFNKEYNKGFEISKDQIHIDKSRANMLGSGDFGCVYRAQFCVNTSEKVDVALKVPKDDTSPEHCKVLLQEIKMLSNLGKHPNLVTGVGAYTEETKYGFLFLAVDLCELGSLKKIISKSVPHPQESIYWSDIPTSLDASLDPNQQEQNYNINLRDLLRWANEIACGMEYLEKRRIIHGDLSASNVLLDSNKVAKVADFGLSRTILKSEKYAYTGRSERFNFKWSALEVLKNGKFTTKSDVWSYGVTIWEIFSMGGTPYKGIHTPKQLLRALQDGFKLAKPENATDAIYNLMDSCLREGHRSRPTFSEIISEISKIMEQAENENLMEREVIRPDYACLYATETTSSYKNDYESMNGESIFLEENSEERLKEETAQIGFVNAIPLPFPIKNIQPKKIIEAKIAEPNSLREMHKRRFEGFSTNDAFTPNVPCTKHVLCSGRCSQGLWTFNSPRDFNDKQYGVTKSMELRRDSFANIYNLTHLSFKNEKF